MVEDKEMVETDFGLDALVIKVNFVQIPIIDLPDQDKEYGALVELALL